MLDIDPWMSIQRRAIALLEKLGDQPTTVALTLHSLGVRGDRHEFDTCLIATYLIQSITEAVHVSVTGDSIEIHFGELDEEGWPKSHSPWVEVYMPTPIEEFVKRFDQGAFEELMSQS